MIYRRVRTYNARPPENPPENVSTRFSFFLLSMYACTLYVFVCTPGRTIAARPSAGKSKGLTSFRVTKKKNAVVEKLKKTSRTIYTRLLPFWRARNRRTDATDPTMLPWNAVAANRIFFYSIPAAEENLLVVRVVVFTTRTRTCKTQFTLLLSIKLPRSVVYVYYQKTKQKKRCDSSESKDAFQNFDFKATAEDHSRPELVSNDEPLQKRCRPGRSFRVVFRCGPGKRE